ncbi:hypothetical protein F4781DRAFT_439391 [Annulohypoxylon bovei var. microspora]|nr:hypothetical protein F4781DRAFT_439391 [Annulohypoxylon bovei var. microspora]
MSIILVFVVAVAITWLVYSQCRPTRSVGIPGIPYVDIDGDKSRRRYMVETGSLMAKGYAQYSKKGIPFSIPNLADFSSPVVVLPLKYLDEVAVAPQSKLSLKEYFSKLGLLRYTYGPPIAEEVQHVARTDLNRALNDLVQPLQEVCLAAFRQDMPRCQEWTSLRPYHTLMSIFVRMTARMLVGSDLHEAWASLSFEYLPVFMKATRSVSTGYNAYMRWIAKYVDTDVKALIQTRRKDAELLRPVLERRLAELESGQGGVEQRHQDAIQ